MTNNLHYLVQSRDDLEALEKKIGKLSEHYGFHCHPIGDDDIINSTVIARMRIGSPPDYTISPFPGCELSLIDLQQKIEDISKMPRVRKSGSEMTVLTIGKDMYTVYHRYSDE